MGSAGCQPAVAGSLPETLLARVIVISRCSGGLGKLPRPAGWQPALPRKKSSRSRDVIASTRDECATRMGFLRQHAGPKSKFLSVFESSAISIRGQDEFVGPPSWRPNSKIGYEERRPKGSPCEIVRSENRRLHEQHRNHAGDEEEQSDAGSGQNSGLSWVAVLLPFRKR